MALVSSRPSVSSPLACSSPSLSSLPQRQSARPLFPTSRPLRPFPSMLNTKPSLMAQKKPTKLIVPPKNFKSEFVLNLTQAEFSRQD